MLARCGVQACVDTRACSLLRVVDLRIAAVGGMRATMRCVALRCVAWPWPAALARALRRLFVGLRSVACEPFIEPLFEPLIDSLIEPPVDERAGALRMVAMRTRAPSGRDCRGVACFADLSSQSTLAPSNHRLPTSRSAAQASLLAARRIGRSRSSFVRSVILKTNASLSAPNGIRSEDAGFVDVLRSDITSDSRRCADASAVTFLLRSVAAIAASRTHEQARMGAARVTIAAGSRRDVLPARNCRAGGGLVGNSSIADESVARRMPSLRRLPRSRIVARHYRSPYGCVVARASRRGRAVCGGSRLRVRRRASRRYSAPR